MKRSSTTKTSWGSVVQYSLHEPFKGTEQTKTEQQQKWNQGKPRPRLTFLSELYQYHNYWLLRLLVASMGSTSVYVMGVYASLVRVFLSLSWLCWQQGSLVRLQLLKTNHLTTDPHLWASGPPVNHCHSNKESQRQNDPPLQQDAGAAAWKRVLWFFSSLLLLRWLDFLLTPEQIRINSPVNRHTHLYWWCNLSFFLTEALSSLSPSWRFINPDLYFVCILKIRFASILKDCS